ncbi:MAG: hypothetical protein ACOYK6_01170 [Chthoniobacterales bacterium]
MSFLPPIKKQHFSSETPDVSSIEKNQNNQRLRPLNQGAEPPSFVQVDSTTGIASQRKYPYLKPINPNNISPISVEKVTEDPVFKTPKSNATVLPSLSQLDEGTKQRNNKSGISSSAKRTGYGNALPPKNAPIDSADESVDSLFNTGVSSHYATDLFRESTTNSVSPTSLSVVSHSENKEQVSCYDLLEKSRDTFDAAEKESGYKSLPLWHQYIEEAKQANTALLRTLKEIDENNSSSQDTIADIQEIQKYLAENVSLAITRIEKASNTITRKLSKLVDDANKKSIKAKNAFDIAKVKSGTEEAVSSWEHALTLVQEAHKDWESIWITLKAERDYHSAPPNEGDLDEQKKGMGIQKWKEADGRERIFTAADFAKSNFLEDIQEAKEALKSEAEKTLESTG